MENIIDKLKGKTVRSTTNKNYLSIWRHFNNFLIRTDTRPDSWEDRTVLFCAYLINQGNQSQTLKSYVSAIKAVLKDDGYLWKDDKILLSSLTKACKIQNDRVTYRFPINKNLLELLLFELKRVLPSQTYLQIMYRAILSLGYYGLMRIGELAEGPHAIKARNIHIGINKQKILIVLYSSKTHGMESLPQKIKITQIDNAKSTSLICPFEAVRSYLTVRGNYSSDSENFFVFRDGNNVTPPHIRSVLDSCLQSLNLDPSLYNFHSLRTGRSCDLVREGYDLERIRQAGRWSSNAVYAYLKQIN